MLKTSLLQWKTKNQSRLAHWLLRYERWKTWPRSFLEQ